MIYKQTLFSSEPYAAPSIKVHFARSHRALCASTGNLNQGDYGTVGYAGGVEITEDDGGSLF